MIKGARAPDCLPCLLNTHRQHAHRDHHHRPTRMHSDDARRVSGAHSPAQLADHIRPHRPQTVMIGPKIAGLC